MANPMTEEQGRRLISLLESIYSALLEIQDSNQSIKIHVMAMENNVTLIQTKYALE